MAEPSKYAAMAYDAGINSQLTKPLEAAYASWKYKQWSVAIRVTWYPTGCPINLAADGAIPFFRRLTLPV